MAGGVSRRELLRAGGAGALGYAALGLGGAAAQTPGRMNVVVVVMDSLRADHVYGNRARTAAWDRVGRQGVRFLNAHPEGMPTIPARRAIMSGKRIPVPRLAPALEGPGAAAGLGASGDRRRDVDGHARQAGLDDRLCDRQPAPAAAGAQALPGGVRPGWSWSTARSRRAGAAAGVAAELDHHLPKALRGTSAEARMRNYLAWNSPGRDEKDYNAAKVFREAMGWINWARRGSRSRS